MKKKQKLDVDKLREDAMDWWNEGQDPFWQEDQVIRMYMREKKIKQTDVDW